MGKKNERPDEVDTRARVARKVNDRLTNCRTTAAFNFDRNDGWDIRGNTRERVSRATAFVRSARPRSAVRISETRGDEQISNFKRRPRVTTIAIVALCVALKIPGEERGRVGSARFNSFQFNDD